MFDFFDNRDKCRKPGFLRGNIHFLHSYGSFRSFCKQKQHFSTLFSLPLPHFLLFPPWVSTSFCPGYQETAINGTLYLTKHIQPNLCSCPHLCDCLCLRTGLLLHIVCCGHFVLTLRPCALSDFTSSCIVLR